MGEAEDWYAAATTELRSRLVAGGAVDDSIAGTGFGTGFGGILVITDPEHAEEWRQRHPMLPSIVLEPGRAYVFGTRDDGVTAEWREAD